MTSQVIAAERGHPHTATMRAPAPDAPPAASLIALLVMLTGTFMVVLDFFIVNVALPSLQKELLADGSMVQLVVAGYGLATAAGLITGGRLGDMFGRRRVFMLGLLLFTLASAGCGLAPNVEVLVAARVLQGLAGALLQPQVLAMIGLVYTGEARIKAFAAYGLTLGLSATLGQLVGGALIHADLAGLGWRSCFLINLPIGAAAMVMARRVIPQLPGNRGTRLDLAGTALVALASVAVVLPLVFGREQGWPQWAWLCLAMSVPLLAALAWQQRTLAFRGGAPLIAPALLAHRSFVLGLTTTLALFIGNGSFYFVLALYLQQGMELEPLASGLVFTSMAVGFFLASMAAPRLARRFGGAPIARGALLLALGHALQLANVAGAGGSHVVAWMVPLLFIEGAGLGIVIAPLVSVVLSGLPPQHAGVASGVVATVQQLGNAIGVALIGIVFYAQLGPAADTRHYAAAMAAGLLFLTGSALLVSLLRWLAQRKG